MSYCPRSSLPVEVLAWLAARLAHLLPPRHGGRGGTPPLSLEVRLDAVGAVVLDGLSYRRAGRMVGISKTEVGDSVALLLGEIAALGVCQPDGMFVTSLADLRQRLAEMAATGEAVCVDGLATRVQRPRSWANQKVLYDAKRHTHTAQGLAVTTVDGDLLWCDGGWPGSCHEHELLELSGVGEVLDATDVVTLVDRGFRGMAKARQHWHAPVGDRRTKDQRTDAERAHNRCQAGLRALVEQSIGHLAGAWSLRRWRGLLVRVRDVYRAAAALVGLARWLHRVPSSRASRTPSISHPRKAKNASSEQGSMASAAPHSSRPNDSACSSSRIWWNPTISGRGRPRSRCSSSATCRWKSPPLAALAVSTIDQKHFRSTIRFPCPRRCWRSHPKSTPSPRHAQTASVR